MAGYSVTFSVVDNASKQIDAINRRIAAMHAPMDRLSKQISRFVDVSGLNTIAKGFTSIGRAAMGVLRTLVEIIPAMGVLTGAATIAGMAKLVSSYASWSQQLTETADSLGMTTQQVQQFENATRLAGGNVADMDSSLRALYEAQGKFMTGQGGDATLWANKLGISFKDATGHARKMADLMPEVIQKVAAIKNPFDRAAAATALLGANGDKLVETFRVSHQSFLQWFTDASRYAGLSDKQKDALQRFTEAQGRAATAFDTLGQQISATVAANFTPLINHLSEFVEKNTPAILAAVDSLSKKFATWLDGIKWENVEKGLQKLIEGITWLINNLDKVKSAAESVATVFAIKWAVNMVSAIAQVTSAIGTITAAVGGGGGAAAAGTGLLGALGAVAVIAGALAAVAGVVYFNKKGQEETKKKAEDMGFEQGGPWYDPTFTNKQTGEKLTWEQMRQRQGKDQGYTPEGYSPTQKAIGDWYRSHAPTWMGGTAAPAPGSMNLPTENVQRGAAIRDKLATDLGLTGAQASGIVGNLQAESGLGREMQEKSPIAGRGGYGWAQWTGPRRVEFENWAKANNLDPKSDEANYGFLLRDLQKPEYAGMLAKLRQQQGPGAAAASAGIFEHDFERPAVSNAGVRGAFASQYAAAQGPAATVPPPSPVNGKVDVAITGKNMPPDSAVTAKGSGAVNVPPPRVEYQDFSTV